MDIILKEKLIGPAVWWGRDLDDDPSWVHQLTENTVFTIQQAVQFVKTKGLSFPHFQKEDFPIGKIRSELSYYADELENGKGFLLLRGMPIEGCSDEEINIINYGLGLHLGTPVCQNPKGDLLGEVMNVGDITKKETRVYETNAYLPYHTDPSDVFGLMSIRKAKSGGMTSVISAGAVYNEILEHYPQYLGLLYRPLPYAHLSKENTDKSPIFSFHEGKLSCRYLRQYIELGCEIQNQPLSRVEIAALDVFDRIIHDQNIRLDMMLEPGDMLLANNYAVMHSRTAFEDFNEPEQRRKLIRLWVKMPNARALAPDFPGRNGFPPPDEI